MQLYWVKLASGTLDQRQPVTTQPGNSNGVVHDALRRPLEAGMQAGRRLTHLGNSSGAAFLSWEVLQGALARVY